MFYRKRSYYQTDLPPPIIKMSATFFNCRLQLSSSLSVAREARRLLEKTRMNPCTSSSLKSEKKTSQNIFLFWSFTYIYFLGMNLRKTSLNNYWITDYWIRKKSTEQKYRKLKSSIKRAKKKQKKWRYSFLWRSGRRTGWTPPSSSPAQPQEGFIKGRKEGHLSWK